MTAALNTLGKITYYLSYPLLAFYLSRAHRTRLIICHNKQVLLVRPRLGDGSWDFPGGGVHKGETKIDGVVRETHEELGIVVDTSRLDVVDDREVNHGLMQYSVSYFRYVVHEKPNLIVQRTELADTRWFIRKDLKTLKLEQHVEELARLCLSKR
jgi:8-oxo-dGTP pyrophosphatase MutT (NUDIX family)